MDETTNQPVTPTIFGSHALVVSPDPDTAGQIQSMLERECHCRVRVVPTYGDAQEALARNGLESVVVDLQSRSTTPGTASFLEHLARQSHKAVLTVGLLDGGYPCEWAGLADLALDFSLQSPVNRETLLKLCQSLRREDLARLLPRLKDHRRIEAGPVRYLTYMPEMFQMLDHLVAMASHDVTLLLIGETGTGKTTMARMVHELSSRRQERFLTVACGALPPELTESELFGHVKGSFTSADRNKVGKFEAAGAGTLLLDEIDVLGPDQQAKLLRVIETGEFEPVGSHETQQTKCRVIVASNVDLKQLMEKGEFRADLYYRLNVLEFHLPPLRQRPLDIVPMALDFIAELASSHAVAIERIHPEFLERLKAYHWPGNIRELKNHIRRAVLFCRTGELSPHDLAPQLLQPRERTNGTGLPLQPETNSLSEKVADAEQEILSKALKANNYNRTATATALGISRVGLYKKMIRYNMLHSHRRRTNGSSPDANKLFGHGD